MFDLEQALAQWRRHMRGAGLHDPAALDELESHLREEIDRQIQRGVSLPDAFAQAVQTLGPTTDLQREFAKATLTRIPRWRLWKRSLLRLLGFPISIREFIQLHPGSHRLGPFRLGVTVHSARREVFRAMNGNEAAGG